MSQPHRLGHHQHDAAELETMMTQGFWDERYSSASSIWSSNPNPRLVEQATDLTPGAALDVGSGEGADAIWLASRGWHVTGIDISVVALDRAARNAALSGKQIADRINWQHTDLLTWEGSGKLLYDLVSAQFMHLPRPALIQLHRKLAAAVRPGGTLLIVGHHPSDQDTNMPRSGVAEMMYEATEVAATLDPADWQILVADAPSRQALDPEGRSVTIHDAVLKAVRRS